MAGMLSEDERGAIRADCSRVLDENWRQGTRRADGVPFGYTSPSLRHYPWQWYWDSCFTAIAWRRLRPQRARIELETLLAAARPDGFIGHTIFWNTPLRGLRRFTYNVVSLSATMTSSIQPPLLAWAWRIAVGDPALEPRIVTHHEWLEHNRDLDGDGLIWIVQPDESGLDASPQFDPIWRWRAHALPGFVPLVRRNRRLRYDIRRIVDAGGPVCCEVATNVLYSLARVALGRPPLTQALIDRCYDERRGLFLPDVRPAPAGVPPVTWAALAPLALPDLPEAIGRRLVEQHLLDADRFWLAAGPASVAADEPSFQRGDRGPLFQRRYWRGPMWVNVAWLLWLGVVRLGYHDAADELVRRVAATVARSGLCEYYDPVSGVGLGQRPFGWSTLIMELTEPAPEAVASYLPATPDALT
jgi:hypothetical protein